MLKCKLNYLSLKRLSIYEQLLYEEVLLRCSNENWFIYNKGSIIPTIVIGYSGKIDELLNINKVYKDNVNVIRRYTGGGTVIVDNNTIFASVIMNNNDANTLPYPRNIMTWSDNTIYGPIFKTYNQSFALREHDYVFNHLKFGGNAQSIIKERWVHHTSFLWDYDHHRMEYLKIPLKKPEYRGERNHHEFLTKLKDHLPSIEVFENDIINQLSSAYDVKHVNEDHIHTIVKDLKDNKDIKSLIRTTIVDINEHMNKKTSSPPSLVKQGPSCTNI